jgi:hypothetical protein
MSKNCQIHKTKVGLIMSNPTNEKEELELEMIEVSYWANKLDDLEWLKNQKQFQSLILEGYFKDKAINGVSLLANETVKREGKRGDIMEMLVAISNLEDYFMTVMQLGAGARADLLDNESPVGE